METATATPTLAIDTDVNATLSELRPCAFSLGLFIRDWDPVPTWVILQEMALIVGLEPLERPFKKPNMKQIHFLWGFLANAIEASDLRKTRSVLADMLRAAHLA